MRAVVVARACALRLGTNGNGSGYEQSLQLLREDDSGGKETISHQPSRVQTCAMATPFTPEQVAWLQSVFDATGLPAPGVPSETSAAGERMAPSPGTAANMAQASSALPPSSSGEQEDMRTRRALAGGSYGRLAELAYAATRPALNEGGLPLGGRPFFCPMWPAGLSPTLRPPPRIARRHACPQITASAGRWEGWGTARRPISATRPFHGRNQHTIATFSVASRHMPANRCLRG